MPTSIWKGSISFGLINIPVSVQSAESSRELRFNLLDSRDLAPIKFKRINGKSGREVPYNRIVKGYQYESGHYIVMKPEDFARANPKATSTIDIQDFVKLEDIDLLMFERPYYLAPQKGGEKGYALLQQALADSSKVAVATVVMHTKEHLTCIFARGHHLVLEIMRFAHEIKDVRDTEAPGKTAASPRFKPAEVKMAEKLIEEMTAKWDPSKYKDSYYDDLTRHIDKRVRAGKGRKGAEMEDETPSADLERLKPTAANDLMSLLKASLEGDARDKRASRAVPKKPRAHGHGHAKGLH